MSDAALPAQGPVDVDVRRHPDFDVNNLQDMRGNATAKASKRVRTVEHDPGCGWIARDPQGREVWPGFRWTSRSVARDVARQARMTPNVNFSGGATTVEISAAGSPSAGKEGSGS